MQTPITIGALALAVAALCGDAAAQRGFFVDSTLGVKLKPPADWDYLGNSGDSGRLRALYADSRAYSPTKVRGAAHTPTMRVLFFPANAPADAAADKGGLPLRTPYRDFADYLSRVHGPDTLASSDEPAKFGKLEGRMVIATVPRERGPLKLHTFVVTRPDGELVVEFEVLGEQHQKLSKTFDKSLKTLATVDVVPDAGDNEPPPWQADPTAWGKLPAGERAKAREAHGKRWFDDRATRKEPGWKIKKSPPFVVATRADPKFTKRVTDAALATHAWADERFAGISDEAVMPAVIRIFADRRELDAFRMRAVAAREYDPAVREIYFYKDAGQGNTGTGFGILMRGVYQHYVEDKAPGVVVLTPRWVDFGVSEYLRSTRVKGRKIEFFESDVETGRFRWYVQNEQQPPAVWTLIQESIAETPKYGAAEEPWGYTPECARMMRWFEEGGGQYLGRKDFLVGYLQAVAASGLNEAKDPGLNVDTLQLTEDQARELRRRRYAWRDEFLAKINQKACNLEVVTWEKANAEWLAFHEQAKKPKKKK